MSDLPLRLHRDRACTRCALSADCASVCIPCSLFQAGPDGADQCLLIVGEAPGVNEDRQDANFVGASGQKLDWMYVAGSLAPQFADTWVANAVRCHPPANADPSAGQLKACRCYLEADLRRLCDHYRRVVVLSVGRYAAQTLIGVKSVAEALKHQCRNLADQGFPNAYLFTTYHPAATLRDPKLDRPVGVHLEAVAEFLETGQVAKEEPPQPQICPRVPADFSGPLAFDTETYGCLIAAPDQRTFHPRRMRDVDSIPYTQQIVCATICWRNACGDIRTGYFDWSVTPHLSMFARWYAAASSIWAQNAQFDLKMIRANGLGRVAVAYSKPLRELMIDSFLYDDLAPERSLKALSWLYRVTDYGDDPAPIHEYAGPDDPRLIHYACKDAWATYRCLELLDQWAEERYSGHPTASSKLSPVCHQWFSDQIWTAVLMEERGLGFNIQELTAVHAHYKADLERLRAESQALSTKLPHPFIISGEGSDGSSIALIADTANWLGEHCPQHTDAINSLEKVKSGYVSTARDNRNALLGLLPRDNAEALPYAQALNMLNEYAAAEKLVSSYTDTRLHGKLLGVKCDYQEVPTKSKKAKNPTRRVKISGTEHEVRDPRLRLLKCETPGVGVSYPSWILIPKEADGAGKGGGTRQFRWSAKDHTLQTDPQLIKKTWCSRFLPGTLFTYDFAQVEWRGSMFLSGDTRGLQEIAENVDIHSESAAFLLGWPDLGVHRVGMWVASADGKRTLTTAPDPQMRAKSILYYSCNTKTDEGMLEFATGVRKWLRQNVGKSQNYAEQYGGGADTIRITTRVKSGIEVPAERCTAFVRRQAGRYPQRAAWRESLIQEVIRYGAIHLPILGMSRSFGGTEEEIRELYREQVLSMPVQTTCHNILACAIMEAQKAFVARGMRSRVVVDRHDSITTDSPADEYADADAIVVSCMRERNWYLEALEAHVGRAFPLEWEAESPRHDGWAPEVTHV